MDSAQREELKRAVRVVSHWTPDRVDEGVISTFINLEELNPNEDEDLWEELRQAILNNTNFEHPPFQQEMKYYRARATRKNDFFWWKVIIRK